MATTTSTDADRAADTAHVITLFDVDHCVNWPLAADRLRAALARTDLDQVRVDWRPVHDAAAAIRTGFAGSPTLLIDGVDPFLRPSSVAGLCCRFYSTEDGVRGAPSVDQLVAALRAADTRTIQALP